MGVGEEFVNSGSEERKPDMFIGMRDYLFWVVWDGNEKHHIEGKLRALW